MTDQVTANGATYTGWRASSYSNDQGGSCLEVLDGHPVGVPVRDSKDPHGPALVVPGTAWAAFVAAVGGGGFPF